MNKDTLQYLKKFTPENAMSFLEQWFQTVGEARKWNSELNDQLFYFHTKLWPTITVGGKTCSGCVGQVYQRIKKYYYENKSTK